MPAWSTLDARGRLAAVLVVWLVAGCGARPQTPLMAAAARGDVAEIDRLVAAGADVRAGRGRGFSPLVWAARNGRVDAVRRLVALGASPNEPAGVNGWTPLEHALHKNQSAAALALLDLGVDVRGSRGLRALAMAAGYGNALLVDALLARGTDPTLDLGDGPSLVGLAAAGVWDIDHEFAGCDAHARTLRVLLRRAPTLRLTDSPWDALAWRYAKWRRCETTLTLLESRGPND